MGNLNPRKCQSWSGHCITEGRGSETFTVVLYESFICISTCCFRTAKPFVPHHLDFRLKAAVSNAEKYATVIDAKIMIVNIQ